MLDRELLIRRLTNVSGVDHERLFRLRREVRALSLPELASRYRKDTGDDPYDPGRTEPPPRPVNPE